ncbi:hypothetical protein ACFQO9_10360 [Chryseobacterium zhengzhouense]|uniref:Quinol oxidase subunit 4 n=1 Tax=Chryseobacterium zhengzhouense TaxID=1636086 RepID=A0ABW2LXS2_9FLAO
MKGLLKITSIIVMAGTILLSCVVHEHHGRRLPPGHAKKVYGGSARHYAPGQVKKQAYYYDKPGHGHKKHKGHHRGRH